MKKFFFCFLILLSATKFSLMAEKTLTPYEKHVDKHFDDLMNSFKSYFLTNKFPPNIGDLNPSFPHKFSLEMYPVKLEESVNEYVTHTIACLNQGDKNLYAAFIVEESIEPYKANPKLIYTSSEFHKLLPSPKLVEDVCNSFYLLKKQPPKDFRIHITHKKEHKNGNYFQIWNFYTEKESQEEEIVFIPDGKGGTFWVYTGKNGPDAVTSELVLERGKNACDPYYDLKKYAQSLDK